MSLGRKEPQIIKGVFSAQDFDALRSALARMDLKNAHFEREFGRYEVDDVECPLLKEQLVKLVPSARRIFESATLLPSYALFVRYQGEHAGLTRHKDDNACTYTIDLCLDQGTPWDLWIEQRPYTVHENEAVAYYGNDQAHWREEFPDPANNRVDMIFFHFVEPDHWFYTRGPDHVEVIRRVTRALARVRDPEQRWFLVLLRDAESAAGLYRSVEQRFPGEDPIDRVFGWVGQLCRAEGALGLDINGSMLLVARRLAEGRRLDQIAEELNASRQRPATQPELRQAEAELRRSCLGPLLP